uniref:Uncharacterized protein n=1 Tax=viral metagenome TaxID=1070528 RepID=A0A6C0D0I7_9ZZZZ
MKLKIEKTLPSSTKKWMAIFTRPGGTSIRTQFGAKGYEDYTIHKDKTRREHYRNRHRKDLDTGDFTRAGFLSYYLLWGDSTSLKKNTIDFKKKFGIEK